MLIDAAEALPRRNTAELAVAEAVEALTAALDELQRHGFELNEIAGLLDVDPSELGGTVSLRRATGRSLRPGKVPEPSLPDHFPAPDPTV